jgi:hypothetical protein
MLEYEAWVMARLARTPGTLAGSTCASASRDHKTTRPQDHRTTDHRTTGPLRYKVVIKVFNKYLRGFMAFAPP